MPVVVLNLKQYLNCLWYFVGLCDISWYTHVSQRIFSVFCWTGGSTQRLFSLRFNIIFSLFSIYWRMNERTSSNRERERGATFTKCPGPESNQGCCIYMVCILTTRPQRHPGSLFLTFIYLPLSWAVIITVIVITIHEVNFCICVYVLTHNKSKVKSGRALCACVHISGFTLYTSTSLP